MANEDTSRARRRLTLTLVAWAAAWPIASLVLIVLHAPLAALPTPLRALVVSGVLVVAMVNAVMPAYARLTRRRGPGGRAVATATATRHRMEEP